jgi:predicted RNase H-like nuclease (RuvC/YqgF family)
VHAVVADRELRDLIEALQAELKRERARAERLEAQLEEKTIEVAKLKRRPLPAPEPRRPRSELMVELAGARRRLGRLEVQLAEKDEQVGKLKSELEVVLRLKRVRRS